MKKQPQNYYPDKYREHYKLFSKDSPRSEYNTHDFFGEGNSLRLVPDEYRNLFLYFFSLEVMLDEIMYTYFKSVYSEFQSETKYPKIDFCGHGHDGKAITRTPWSVLEAIPKNDKDEELFESAIARFLTYQQELFGKKEYLPSWGSVVAAIENDKDMHPIVGDITRGAITLEGYDAYNFDKTNTSHKSDKGGGSIEKDLEEIMDIQPPFKMWGTVMDDQAQPSPKHVTADFKEMSHEGVKKFFEMGDIEKLKHAYWAQDIHTKRAAKYTFFLVSFLWIVVILLIL